MRYPLTSLQLPTLPTGTCSQKQCASPSLSPGSLVQARRKTPRRLYLTSQWLGRERARKTATKCLLKNKLFKQIPYWRHLEMLKLLAMITLLDLENSSESISISSESLLAVTSRLIYWRRRESLSRLKWKGPTISFTK